MNFEESIYNIVTKAISDKVPQLVDESVQKIVGKQTLTTSDVEEKYGIDAMKQYHLRQKRKVTYIQDGRKILYPRESIDKYIADHTVPGDY